MNNDTGYLTPEFVVTVLVNIAAAVVAILAARGLLTPDEGELWVALVEAVALPVALLVMSIVTKQYLAGQTTIRQAKIMAGIR